MANRDSIIKELQNALQTNMASVTRIRQIFEGRDDDELQTFANECPQELRDALQSMGFNVPTPQVDAAQLVPFAQPLAQGYPEAVVEQSTGAAPQDVSILASILAFFGIGRHT